MTKLKECRKRLKPTKPRMKRKPKLVKAKNNADAWLQLPKKLS
jgi:hypothetical protein